MSLIAGSNRVGEPIALSEPTRAAAAPPAGPAPAGLAHLLPDECGQQSHLDSASEVSPAAGGAAAGGAGPAPGAGAAVPLEPATTAKLALLGGHPPSRDITF